MADGPDVAEILRRTVQANARLYKGWVDLSLEYWRGVGEIFGVAPPPGPQDAATAGESDDSGMVVLEAEAGSTARGAFLVTNDLGRPIRCDLVASEMRGPRGAEAAPKVTFDPPSFELAPGEQRVVTATTIVGDRLAAGAAYTGTVSIRGLEGFSVPFVLRRTHTLADAERAAQRSGSEEKAGASARADAGAGPSAAGSPDTAGSDRPRSAAGSRAAPRGKGKKAPKATGEAQPGKPGRRRGKVKE